MTRTQALAEALPSSSSKEEENNQGDNILLKFPKTNLVHLYIKANHDTLEIIEVKSLVSYA